MRVVRDDPDHPDPGFAELYAGLPEPRSLEPWLGFCQEAAPPVLYLGIGAARIAEPLARHGIRLVGVDAHPGMLAAARAKLPSGELIQARIEDLQLGRRFDLVIAPSSILNTGERLLAAARHLSGDGRLLFELMNPHWLQAGANPGVRILKLDRRRAEIEVDYPGGFVQPAAVALVWPEEMEDFLATAGLELQKMWGSSEDLEAAPTFFVLARRRAASCPPAAT